MKSGAKFSPWIWSLSAAQEVQRTLTLAIFGQLRILPVGDIGSEALRRCEAITAGPCSFPGPKCTVPGAEVGIAGTPLYSGISQHADVVPWGPLSDGVG